LVLETGFGGCVIQTIPLGLLNSYRLWGSLLFFTVFQKTGWRLSLMVL
jgi:hypothetical protein